MKIDLLDSSISSDLFDEERYQEVASDESLEKILNLAVAKFKEANPSFESWKDWEQGASEGGHEMEIFSDDPESLFRGSILLRDKKAENALKLAMKYHFGQTRKGDGLEYIIHILQITRLLDKRGFGPEILAAAFCHDLLEDTDCSEAEIRKQCGKEVLRIVKAVSNDKRLEGSEDWEKKKLKYIESVLRDGEKAIAVCVADKIVNLRSLLKEYQKTGDAIWSRFNRGRDKKLWFEKKVLAMARKNWKNPLVKEYASLVRELEDSDSENPGDRADSRKELIETINYLIDLRQAVFGKALNHAMKGDLREIDEAFDEGDIFDFNLEDLKGGADQNVQKLVGLVEVIEQAVDSLININRVEKEELASEK